MPDVTPDVGGLVHELFGRHLDGGSEYRCRFGALVVHATFDVTADSVLCVSPAGLRGRVQVAVSLNGQQFSKPSATAYLSVFDVDGEELELEAEVQVATTN
uniref:Uncharacterized protein n=1 Tax=Coccolithus braarudii TaxID=221442 RepID=A0A7S0LTJ1_9EUKA|mmetsp:Transcript_9768/g.21271  ORF Transcript_9768/g.21271 Transcript_9768/m.21271 type:complete len:101 (+) Transcript_9768:1-303(+)